MLSFRSSDFDWKKREVTIIPMKGHPSSQKYLGDVQLRVLEKLRDEGLEQVLLAALSLGESFQGQSECVLTGRGLGGVLRAPWDMQYSETLPQKNFSKNNPP